MRVVIVMPGSPSAVSQIVQERLVQPAERVVPHVPGTNGLGGRGLGRGFPRQQGQGKPRQEKH